MEEKRRDKRLELDGVIILSRLDSNDAAAKQAKVNIRDVSKSGIGFTCSETLAMGAVYECVLTIWTKETIHCFVEIVRSFAQSGEFVYGGIFIGMSEMDIKRIEIYTTFQEQLDK